MSTPATDRQGDLDGAVEIADPGQDYMVGTADKARDLGAEVVSSTIDAGDQAIDAVVGVAKWARKP